MKENIRFFLRGRHYSCRQRHQMCVVERLCWTCLWIKKTDDENCNGYDQAVSMSISPTVGMLCYLDPDSTLSESLDTCPLTRRTVKRSDSKILRSRSAAVGLIDFRSWNDSYQCARSSDIFSWKKKLQIGNTSRCFCQRDLITITFCHHWDREYVTL